MALAGKLQRHISAARLFRARNFTEILALYTYWHRISKITSNVGYASALSDMSPFTYDKMKATCRSAAYSSSRNEISTVVGAGKQIFPAILAISAISGGEAQAAVRARNRSEGLFAMGAAIKRRHGRISIIGSASMSPYHQ